MSETPWAPDLAVAVHDDELIVRFDHLPSMRMEQVRAEMEDGGVVLSAGNEEHRLHVPLPESVSLGAFDLRPVAGMFELRMHVQR